MSQSTLTKQHNMPDNQPQQTQQVPLNFTVTTNLPQETIVAIRDALKRALTEELEKAGTPAPQVDLSHVAGHASWE
jgi:hypothetical protein